METEKKSNLAWANYFMVQIMDMMLIKEMLQLMYRSIVNEYWVMQMKITINRRLLIMILNKMKIQEIMMI